MGVPGVAMDDPRVAMGVQVGLVHRDPCECKIKGFRAVSSIERNVSNRRHLQGVRHLVLEAGFQLTVLAS